jgi:magnesium-transporting ATPase (P-type)
LATSKNNEIPKSTVGKKGSSLTKINSINKSKENMVPEKYNSNFKSIFVKSDRSSELNENQNINNGISVLKNVKKSKMKKDSEMKADSIKNEDKFITRKNDYFYSKKELENLARNIKYCGPSPDEISLLAGCKDSCGYFFVGADAKRVVIQTSVEKFEVEKLLSNEFESTRKMMSVLIKYKGKGITILRRIFLIKRFFNVQRS